MLFVDRREELDNLIKRTLEFPRPGEEASRARRVLVLIGPKGVGKTSLLKEFIRQGAEDTKFIYVEFRGPYESAEDLLIDLLHQYRESLRESAWKEALERVVTALGIKILGEDFIQALTTPDNIELLRRARPSLILRDLEEESCKLCEQSNSRLVVIYDEFQNFLKATPMKGTERFNILLDSFITYFSKSQEWGFNSTKGYPIRILSTSDYTFYRLLGRYLTSYIEEEYVEELSEEWSRELFQKQLDQHGLKGDELAAIYAAKAIGGNPSLFSSLTMKLKARNKGSRISVDDVEKAIGELEEEALASLQDLDYYEKSILRTLSSLAEAEEWVSMEMLEKPGIITREEIERWVSNLLLANILQIRRGMVAFQNRAVKYAARRI